MESYRNDMDQNSEEKNFWRYIRENGKITITNGIEFQGIIISPQGNNQIKITKN
jgi:transketolase